MVLDVSREKKQCDHNEYMKNYRRGLHFDGQFPVASVMAHALFFSPSLIRNPLGRTFAVVVVVV